MKNKLNVTAVGDSAHDLAEDIRTDLANLGADALRVATDYIGPRARDLADYITPRVRDAADNVVEYVQPRATDLGRRGVQFATDTRDAVQPKLVAFAHDTRDAVQPKLVAFATDTRDTVQPKLVAFAHDTRDHVQPLIGDARDRLQPHLDDAVLRVQPLVEAGRERFNADVMPHIVEVLDNVNAMPQTQEAKERLVAAKAALAGELTLPSPAELVVVEPKKSIRKTLLQVLVAGGLLAGVAYAFKRFLAPEDSGWQAHEPSEAYLREDESPVAEATGAADASEPVEASEPPADEPAEAATEATTASPYGAGSYVGAAPGPEFVIKGNERSMKYHVAGSGGFDRTIADVWFDSEETAQAAGFTKAQR